MAGMLTQAQNPSSGSGPLTPPTDSPGAGIPPVGSAAPGSEQPMEAEQAGQMPNAEDLTREATVTLYGDNFDNMMEMFESNGPEGFAQSTGRAVNSAIDGLEQEYGPLPVETAAEVGMNLILKLVEDMVVKGLMPDVSMEQVQDSIPAALMMYADTRPDITREDIQAVIAEIANQSQGGGEGGADPNAPLSTGPGPEPSGSPVPPGVTV